ncbi:TfoX/Sxy family protein [Cellulomonas sp. SG140]|uniref:TfoX/Sxy family protein n=1 Tax=Cellulomonas sp. SG140 TaxID=2976536 RepID=UPI0021E9629F|nr:TfoX/Sxy family protein [Cellulomonas sp. SG140]
MAAVQVVDRIRTALAGRDVREVPMFGGISFMVDGRLVVASRPHGDLLVRIDPARREELSARPGAEPAVMGTGRRMGDAWLSVTREQLEGDGLGEWLAIALDGGARSAGA